MSETNRDLCMAAALLVAIVMAFAHPNKTAKLALALAAALAGVFLAAAMLTGCTLDTGDQDLDFEFPVEGVDTLDPVTQVWTGQRDYRGKQGARIQYTQACASLITTKQHGYWYITGDPAPGPAYLKMTVQGPCAHPMAVRILPAN
jgi:hypothetical protein